MTAIPFLVDPQAYYGRELREPPPCVRGECAGEYVGMSAVEVWERQGVRNQMERRPRLLDLFCGAGGCSVGYHRTGFDVVGVDIKPQPRYPFPFCESDALELMGCLLRRGYFRCTGSDKAYWLSDFDAIHASPPCQGYSRLRHLPWLKHKTYPLLIDPVRESLEASGKLWVIENSNDAPLSGVFLCGTMFGLPLYRHRRFECSVLLMRPHHKRHEEVIGRGRMLNDRGKGSLNNSSAKGAWGNQNVVTVAGGQFKKADGERAMGIDWMNCAELSQAIPPAYTEWIGKQLLGVCRPAQVPVDMVFDERGLRTVEGNGNG